MNNARRVKEGEEAGQFVCTWNLFANIPKAGSLMDCRVVAFSLHGICTLLTLERFFAKSLVLACKDM